MTPLLMLTAWLVAAAPPGGEVKDRACFARCNEQIAACSEKCPPLPESTDEEGDDDGKPKKGKKAVRQPTAAEQCHIGCMKKSESCLKGCK